MKNPLEMLFGGGILVKIIRKISHQMNQSLQEKRKVVKEKLALVN